MIARMAVRAAARGPGQRAPQGKPPEWGPAGKLLGALVLFVAPIVAWPLQSLIVIGVLAGMSVLFMLAGHAAGPEQVKRDQALAELMKNYDETGARR